MTSGHPTEKPSWKTANPFLSAASSAPEFSILLAIMILVVAWARNGGVFPGSIPQFLGNAGVGLSLACLYAGLGMLYSRISFEEGKSPRKLLRILGVCLLLAITSTYILRLLLTPSVWQKFFYLRYISPPAFVGLWCAALLPRETRELCGTAKATRAGAILRAVAILLIVAAIFVTCSDLSLQFGAPSGSDLKKNIIQRNAWITNILILFSAYALAFAFTSKVATALLFVSPFYVVLGLATLAKLKYMHAVVTPLDLLSVPEFLPLFRSFFGTGVLAASIGGSIAWVIGLVALRRIEPYRIPSSFRWAIGVVSLAALLAIAYSLSSDDLKHELKLYRRIGAPKLWADNAEGSTRTSGVLLTFMAEIPSSFVFAPSGYSRETVTFASQRFPGHAFAPTDNTRGRRVNLIVYMIESFMYPEDLGWHYSSDPIPNMRILQRTGISGHGIVPNGYGGSADSEFETLTGMTMCFLPTGSIPYRQFVKTPLPSLPGALKHLGYRTIAVQADPKNYFNREQVYGLMGFDQIHWLRDDPGFKPSERGYWPSDKAIVESVIEASRQSSPFFIFAFPSSTHSPYNSGIYGNSDLDVLDPPPGNAAGEVKEYINALRVADRAIGRLIDHFRRQPDPTIIAVVGDHIPPLSAEAFHLFDTKLAGMSKAEQTWKIRRVPLLVWTNFDLPREEMEMSLNALPSYLFGKMSISPQGFLAVTDAVRLKLPILSGAYVRGADGSVWDRDSLPPQERALVDDYQLLQYDLLFGRHFSLRGSTLGEGANRGGREYGPDNRRSHSRGEGMRSAGISWNSP